MHKPIFYDTDCLSCFITVNKTWILRKIYEKIIIPKEVYKEFKKAPKNHIKEIDKLMDDKFIEVKTIQTNTPEYYTYKQIKDGDITGRYAGKGESAALTLAIHNNGIIASNNTRDIIEIVKEYQVEWIRVGDILEKAVINNIITQTKADEIWKEMKDKGRYLGKWKTLKEYVDEKYSNK